MNKEELLQQARERYPPGTKFKAAHINSETCIITCINFIIYDHGYLCETLDRDYPSSNKRNCWNCVYYNDTWAEIITKGNQNYYSIY